MRQHGWLGVAVTGAASLIAPPLLASGALVVDTVEPCPDRVWFVRQTPVSVQTAGALFQIRQEGDTYVGTLVLAGRTPVIRSVRSPSCLVVAEALAAIAQIRADSGWSGTAGPAARATSHEALDAGPATARPRGSALRGLARRLEIGAFAGLDSLTPGRTGELAGILVRLSPSPRWGAYGGLSLLRGWGGFDRGGTHTRLDRVVGRGDFVPYAIKLGRGFHLSPGVHASLSSLRVRPGVPRAIDEARALADIGGGVRAMYVTRWFSAELAGEASLVLTPRRFVLTNAITPLARLPVWAPGIFLTLSFPLLHSGAR